MDTPRTASTPSRNDNESLSREGRNPDVPISELGVSAGTDNASAPAQDRIATGVAQHADNESLSPSTDVLNIAFADELVELRSRASELIDDGNDVRFKPISNSLSTTPPAVCFQVGGIAEHEAWLIAAQRHTFDAIDWFGSWREKMQDLRPSTVDNGTRLLTCLFSEPVIDDPILGYLRPPVLPELLVPDMGRAIVFQIAKGLADLGDVAGDLLRTFRIFGKFICDGGAYLPESGVNLRDLYGVLVCPLGDRDIKRRKVKSEVWLPTIEQMPLIHEAIYDWTVGVKTHKWAAQRTATVTTLCLESGIRGVESRSLDFDDHAGGVSNPLNVRSAKNTKPRHTQVDPWGWELLSHWLTEQRDQHAPTGEGAFFPVTDRDGAELSSSSFYASTKRLLDHLKAKKLLHSSFTFHACRKTYATHFIERNGTNVDALLEQCGWSSPIQLGTYVRPSQAAISQQHAQFHRTQGLRRTA